MGNERVLLFCCLIVLIAKGEVYGLGKATGRPCGPQGFPGLGPQPSSGRASEDPATHSFPGLPLYKDPATRYVRHK
jgi:hypothetical protein